MGLGQLHYINCSTSLFLLHVGLILVYPTISPLRVSYCLSLGFEAFFVGPRIILTSSPLPMRFFFFFFFSCTSSMCFSYAVHEHVLSPHSYSWEPRTFFAIALIGNSLCWVFFQDHCMGLY